MSRVVRRCRRWARSTGVGTRLHRSEAGFVAGSDALILGVLVAVVGTLVLLNAWLLLDARLAATAVAREVVRVVTTAPADADPVAVAERAAAGVADGHGIAPDRLQLAWTVPVALERCAEVAVEVRIAVPLALLPSVGAVRAEVPVRAHGRGLVDPFRDGLPEGDGCAS